MPSLPPQTAFDQFHKGLPVSLLYLQNSKGWTAALTNYGARLVSLLIPDHHGEFINVVAGFDSLNGYLNSSEHYYGATVGRYANRIANAQFSIGQKVFQLVTEDPGFCLHGGPQGFHQQVWDILSFTKDQVVFHYTSPDGEMGFPGKLEVDVIYQMTENGLRIQYEATTDQPTICNLTHHSFFNLNGAGTVEEHGLMINADYYLPMNDHWIPTGELALVKDSPFDFNTMMPLGSRIDSNHPQLKLAGGYDHNFVLRNKPGIPAAVATGNRSGIIMSLYTDKPGLQLYTTNGLVGKNLLSNGECDVPRSSFCLEPQLFPNSPNEPAFPSALLLPGQHYQRVTDLQFSLGLL